MKHELTPAAVAGVFTALLTLSAWPAAWLLTLVCVIGVTWYAVRRLTPAGQGLSAWRFGAANGLVIGGVHLAVLLAYFILNSTVGGRMGPSLWLFPTTIGSLIMAGTLRAVCFAALGALVGWMTAPRAESPGGGQHDA